MKIVKTISRMQSLSDEARRQGRPIGFVPTMGALHDGHRALIRTCRRENKLCVTSIFVNPLQFGPDEDFARYPRPEKKDVLLAKKEKVDIIFYPSVKEMVPTGFLTTIDVTTITAGLCGRFRPGHFRGVTTVVGKLLNIVQPHRLYLGQKDAQQCAVIRQMIRDMAFPVHVRIIPTVRESDGLALSSRNKYLSREQRREAVWLYRSLQAARRYIGQGHRQSREVKRFMRRLLRENTKGRVEYIACVDPKTMQAVTHIQKGTLIAMAVQIGPARLIDNIIVRS